METQKKKDGEDKGREGENRKTRRSKEEKGKNKEETLNSMLGLYYLVLYN